LSSAELSGVVFHVTAQLRNGSGAPPDIVTKAEASLFAAWLKPRKSVESEPSTVIELQVDEWCRRVLERDTTWVPFPQHKIHRDGLFYVPLVAVHISPDTACECRISAALSVTNDVVKDQQYFVPFHITAACEGGAQKAAIMMQGCCGDNGFGTRYYLHVADAKRPADSLRKYAVGGKIRTRFTIHKYGDL
jgi:hypothetical protein